MSCGLFISYQVTSLLSTQHLSVLFYTSFFEDYAFPFVVSALKRLQVDDLSNNGYELLYHWNLFHPGMIV